VSIEDAKQKPYIQQSVTNRDYANREQGFVVSIYIQFCPPQYWLYLSAIFNTFTYEKNRWSLKQKAI
jgi:hypothetical protein